jgi:citrate synthase
LTLLTIALGLPPRSAFSLFIISRTAGWVAHIVEQRESGALIRPRADYLQTPPAPDDAADLLPAGGTLLSVQSSS